MASGYLHCFHCQKKIEFKDRIGFKEECFHCRSDLHACKNCHFYDKGSYNECKEPSADVVKDKEKANYCEFFQPNQNGAVVDQKAQLKAAAEALFKKNN